MNAAERQQAIANILVHRRQETMENLAAEFGVSRRTIVSDITALTCSLPIESVRGHHGGVRLADWYRPHRQTLSPEQAGALRRAATRAEGEEKRLLLSVLAQFSSPV